MMIRVTLKILPYRPWIAHRNVRQGRNGSPCSSMALGDSVLPRHMYQVAVSPLIFLISLPPCHSSAGNRKKRSRSAKAEEKQRRAEKREKHLKETRGPEKQQEDDGNNVLYANSTYYVGGRAEQANAAFGGNAIISSKNH